MIARTISRFAIGTLPGVMLMVALAAAPLLAMPDQPASSERFLGVEMQKGSGAGLVIMVSLQRQ